ncbi:TVP38/TMEM64 family protein [Bacillus benzoevorans]|uniref:TVP38/TMEM64 family membrane protein n=1 Tax=Bacillus benzoevorans TaxID=1456 RepID=A0A7X0LV90_9BACI|nr:putative membrane protein YdjX (TVP38/TMEM64 family) [Bacillus benzoevorans]
MLKLILVLLILFLLPLFAKVNSQLFHSVLNGDIQAIRASVAGNFISAYLLTLILMIIQNTFTIIPLILIITLNFTLFGFIKGFIWGWVTSVIAAAMIYLCVKYIFQDKLMKKFKPELIQTVEQKGFSYVFKGRLFPFVPTSLVNILAALSSIHFKDFLWGTAAGNFLYFFILTLIPAGFFSSAVNHYVWGALILLFIMIFYILKRNHKQKQKSLIVHQTEQNHTHFHDRS